MSKEPDSGRRFTPPAISYSANGRANQKAWAAMSLLERELGKTREQVIAEHQEQRARVLRRYGLAA